MKRELKLSECTKPCWGGKGSAKYKQDYGFDYIRETFLIAVLQSYIFYHIVGHGPIF